MQLVLGGLLIHPLDHLSEDRLLYGQPLFAACFGRGRGLAFQRQAYPFRLELIVGRIQEVEDLRDPDVGNRLVEDLFYLDRSHPDVQRGSQHHPIFA